MSGAGGGAVEGRDWGLGGDSVRLRWRQVGVPEAELRRAAEMGRAAPQAGLVSTLINTVALLPSLFCSFAPFHLPARPLFFALSRSLLSSSLLAHEPGYSADEPGAALLSTAHQVCQRSATRGNSAGTALLSKAPRLKHLYVPIDCLVCVRLAALQRASINSYSLAIVDHGQDHDKGTAQMPIAPAASHPHPATRRRRRRRAVPPTFLACNGY